MFFKCKKSTILYDGTVTGIRSKGLHTKKISTILESTDNDPDIKSQEQIETDNKTLNGYL